MIDAGQLLRTATATSRQWLLTSAGLSVRRSVLLSVIEKFITMLFGMLVLVVVSRLLTASEIGVSALGIGTLTAAESLRDFSAGNYIIQHANLSDRHVRTAFTVTLLISVTLALFFFLAAPAIASFYHTPELAPFLRVLCLTFLIAPFFAVPAAYLRREMAFGIVAMANIASIVAAGLTTITLAATGFSYMSYAWGGLVCIVVNAVIVLFARPAFKFFIPCLDDWREILHFGGVSSATGLLTKVCEVLPLMILGRYYASDTVGLFSRAQLLCQIPDRLVVSTVSTVALPALAGQGRSGRKLAQAYLAALSYITAFHWPAFCFLAILARPIVTLALGEKWLSIVPMVQILSISLLASFPAVLTYPVLVAAGGLRDTLKNSLVTLLASGALMLLAVPAGPLAMATIQLAVVPLQAVIAFWFIRRHTTFSMGEFWHSLHASALATAAAMVLPVLYVFITGPATIGLGGLIVAGLGAIIGWSLGIFYSGHLLREEFSRLLSRLGPSRPQSARTN